MLTVFIQGILSAVAMSPVKEQPDRIGELFRGRTVFVTGGTGFLGKVLVEKLLRCSEVDRIFLLIRNKKGKRPQERITELFSNVLFSKLKQERPESLKKCIVISGDVTEIDLGISAEDRKTLQEETEFIFHLAASTRFDDSLRVAVRMNTRGTKYVLDLASNCKNLKAFAHVSTAFAFPNERVTYEKPYKPPADPNKILSILNFDKDEDPKVEKALLQGCPNTYVFSKALAEGLVVEQMDKLPIVIIRPSVVCPVFKDPLPGWCNNLQGPMGLFVGAGKGVIRSVYINKDAIADFIPVDIVINGVLLTTWNYLSNKDTESRIVNAVTSNHISLSWEELINTGKDIIYNHIPFNTIAWYPGGTLENSRFIHTMNFYLFQLIPAILIDLFLFLLGYKPVLYQIQWRIQKGLQMFEFFGIKNWVFASTRADVFHNRMNEREKKIYKIDASGVVVKDYLTDCIMCVRRNNLKETDDMLPKARLVMKIMSVVDKVCKTAIIIIFLYYLYKWILVPVFRV